MWGRRGVGKGARGAGCHEGADETDSALLRGLKLAAAAKEWGEEVG